MQMLTPTHQRRKLKLTSGRVCHHECRPVNANRVAFDSTCKRSFDVLECLRPPLLLLEPCCVFILIFLALERAAPLWLMEERAAASLLM